jgi:hypothetical protein
MPFGPMNAPAVYTTTMKVLDNTWVNIFYYKFAHYRYLRANSRTIEDAILSVCTDPLSLVELFGCTKYRFISARATFSKSVWNTLDMP